MNKDIILRLTKYKRLLYKLKALGFERVFSNNLGDAIGVTPALVRKDFSTLNLPGNKRGGYNIDMLIERLDNLLGRDQPQHVIVVGCGRIGTALMQYSGFSTDGIEFVAGFDIRPEEVRPPSSIPVYGMETLEEFIREHHIRVGVIAVPDTEASKVLTQMVEAGIRGVLNFAPVELKCHNEECHSNCIIHNVNIALEIEHLFYQVNAKEAGEEEDGNCAD
ncbi:redox-sensing transcriptional repressor Rex [Sediminispirochaeta bajacaliforniensis]|uniref:redox-sensing transcriptional repressor Rex n=1 Tax=Sediminispirochaeta bajacaliforniensis TaxID=148 RepID=UPI000378E5D4|nr:redox-sensing transcriptional repressor Rex [Sediminispirochaeta bajacaliforniensis]